MRAISYAFFGAKNYASCFEPNAYIRGFMLNIRLARLFYNDWQIILHTDQTTKDLYPIIYDLEKHQIVRVVVCEPAQLTKAMLWRMKPIFETDSKHEAVYEHVICRDLDSPLTYKERLCVQEWIDNNDAAHAMTDSVSHNKFLMGGMIGFIPKYFTMLTGFYSWEDMMYQQRYDWEQKGSDQDFLDNAIYPKFAQHGKETITQHYLLGLGKTWLKHHYSRVPDINLEQYGIPSEMREAWAAPHQGLCGHIGAAGHYSPTLENFLRKYSDRFEDIKSIESNYPDLFYWVKTNEL